jgi:hypothetical protein
MAFPQDVLGNKAEIYYDGEWHAITTDVRGTGAQDGEIGITARGEPDESTALQPTQATLSLNNQNGRYSPRNAHSDLYGKIGTNTPIRISTDITDTLTVEDQFTGTRTDTWGTADVSGHTWNNTGGVAADYDVASGVGTHAQQANSTVHFSQVLNTVGGDPLQVTDFDIYVMGVTVSATPITGAAMEVGIRGRLTAFEPDYVEGRIFFTTSNAVTCNLRYVQGYAEIATTAFTAVSGATNGSTISFRFQAEGDTLRLKAWVGSTYASEPEAWTLELTTNYVYPGYFSLYSLANGGNTNAKPISLSYQGIKAHLGMVLFTGEVVEWPKKWDRTGNDVWVPLVATGITRRLRQGNRPIRSPLYRYYTRDLGDLTLGTVQTTIQHYWSMEDLAHQTRYIRDEIGNSVLAFDVATHNTVEWSSNDFVVGSGKLVTITGLPIPEGVVVVPFISDFVAPNSPDVAGFETFTAPDVTDPDTFTYSCWFYFPPLLEDFPFLPATSLYFSFAVPDSPILNIFVDIQYRPDTDTFAGVLDSTSGDLTDTGSLPYTDVPHLLVIDWYVDGADLWTCDVYVDNSIILSDSASFRPFVNVTRFDLEVEPYSPITVGHMTMETGTLFTRTLSFRTNIYEAGQGFPGETAVARFTRLCETEGVAYEVFSVQEDIDFPVLMGPQRPGNFIDHLDDISLADGGVIYELRAPFGYGFRTRASLYGTAAALTLDYANGDLGEVPNVTGDDQNTRNIIRAKLRGGTQGELSTTITDGPLGTVLAGEYEDGGIEVALNSTSQLQEWIDWAAFLGTWDEDRWPELTIHLHRPQFYNSLQKFVDAMRLEVGQLLRISNPPEWVADAGVVQQMRAVGITLSNFTFSLTYTLLPGGPYALPQLNNTDADRADTSECYLVGPIDTDDTDLIVTTYMTETPYDTPLWTVDPTEFNAWGHAGIGLRLNPPSRAGGTGGERVSVGDTAPVRDTFTRSASQLAGSNADTGQTWVSADGVATDLVVNGTSAVATHTVANTSVAASIPTGDVDHGAYVQVATNFTTATGADFRMELMVRANGITNCYKILLAIGTGTSNVILRVFKVIGGVGTEMTPAQIVVGTNTSGVPIHMRMSVVSNSLKAKAWVDGAEEPEWQFDGVTATTDVLNGTDVIIRSFRLTGNTNVNAASTWDNFSVHTPKIRPVVWDRFAYTVLNNPDGAFPDDLTYPTTYNWFTAGLVEADLDFTPNQFQVTASTTNAYGAIYLDQLDYPDAVATVVWTCPVVTGTGGLEPGNIMMRGTLITEYILFRNFVTVDNQIFTQIYSRTGVFLGQAYIPPDGHRVDRPMKTKAACFGTQLMMKTWDVTQPEPQRWQLVVTDPDPQSGWIGLRAGRQTGNTNASAAMTFHEFRVENPQRITVTRSTNGVVKAWDAGTDVRLYAPMILGR